MLPTNPMRFEIRPASGGCRVHFTDAKNGKTILWSQVYNDEWDAEYAITLTRLYAPTAPTWNLLRLYKAVMESLRRRWAA